MATTFTGNKDTDFLMLMQLNDYELGKVCEVNKYANSLCKDEKFWFNRINKNMQESVAKNFEIYSKYVRGLKKPVSVKSIEISKKFYGFDTNIEFYKFLKKITDKYPKIFYFVIIYSQFQEKLINILYDINKDEFPDWIKYDNFIGYLRREILQTSLSALSERRINGIVFNPFKEKIPGFATKGNIFRIPDQNFIMSLLPEMKRDISGLPIYLL